MFECTLEQGELFRKIITALSDLVQEGNFMIDGSHISFQGMDSSHVSLCALSLRNEGFRDYRCDRELTLGLNFQSMQKILKCMGSKDSLSIRHEEDTDLVLFIFEDNNASRISNFELKLMDIDAEQLGIPDTEYSVTVKMPGSEFQRICRDLQAIGDAVTIEVTKEGVTFAVDGQIGTGKMSLKGRLISKPKKANQDETAGGPVKEEHDDENMGMNDEDVESGNIDDPDCPVMIQMNEPVSQQFALSYLNIFTKASNLCKSVTLQMAPGVPLMCEYQIDNVGYLRYYLAPKIDEE